MGSYYCGSNYSQTSSASTKSEDLAVVSIPLVSQEVSHGSPISFIGYVVVDKKTGIAMHKGVKHFFTHSLIEQSFNNYYKPPSLGDIRDKVHYRSSFDSLFSHVDSSFSYSIYDKTKAHLDSLLSRFNSLQTKENHLALADSVEIYQDKLRRDELEIRKYPQASPKVPNPGGDISVDSLLSYFSYNRTKAHLDSLLSRFDSLQTKENHLALEDSIEIYQEKFRRDELRISKYPQASP
jgi:uncharacterized coiled-coil protein SlyX